MSATESDVQLFWGEPLDGVAERIARLKGLEQSLERDLPPLEFGLRITTLVRDTTEEAWHDAEAKVAKMAEQAADDTFRQKFQRSGFKATGQQRLLDLAEQGDVLDACLYTAPGRYGGGGAGTTWLVGSAEDVAHALRKYQELGITHFVLSDTPYRTEIARVGDPAAAAARRRSWSRSRRDGSGAETVGVMSAAGTRLSLVVRDAQSLVVAHRTTPEVVGCRPIRVSSRWALEPSLLIVEQVSSKESDKAAPKAKTPTTSRNATPDQMVPISPVTKPAVALPRPPSRPPEASISRPARRPMTIAGIPVRKPATASDRMPSTRDVVAGPCVVATRATGCGPRGCRWSVQVAPSQ